MKRKITYVAAGVLLVAGMLVGATPKGAHARRGPAGGDGVLARCVAQLDLSEKQQKQLAKLRETMDKDMRSVLKAGKTPDPGTMAELRQKHLEQLESILTEEQLAKLTAIRAFVGPRAFAGRRAGCGPRGREGQGGYPMGPPAGWDQGRCWGPAHGPMVPMPARRMMRGPGGPGGPPPWGCMDEARHDRWMRGRAMMKPRLRTHPLARLDLTAQQKAQLKKLGEKYRAEMEQLRTRHRREMESLLTEEQRARLERMKDEALYGRLGPMFMPGPGTPADRDRDRDVEEPGDDD